MARGRGRRTDYAWSNVGDVMAGRDITIAAEFGPTSSQFALPGTVVRIRGKVGVTLDTGGVDESAMILCGLGIFDADQVTAGAAPEIDASGGNDDASWMWTGALYVTSGAEAAVTTNGLYDRLEIDTKAMRRIKPNEVIAFVTQAPPSLATDQAGTYDLTYWFHILTGF